MTVPEPITDEMFKSPDESLASALKDVDDLDVAAELVSIHGITIDEAQTRVLNEPVATRATVMRARTDAL